MAESEGYFKTRMSFEPRRDAIWKPVVRYLERYIPGESRILELGAGYCSFINEVHAGEKHALDSSDIIRQYAAESVRIHVCDCAQLRPVETAYFDVVFSSFLFEHLTRDHLDRLMRELRRIIKPGGLIITLLPNYKYIYRHYFDDYTHVQVFSHLSFSDYLTAQGFDVTRVEGRFLPFSFKSRLPKSAFLTALYLRSPWKPFAGNMLVIARNPDTPAERAPVVREQSRRREPPPRSPRPFLDEPVAPVSILKDQKTMTDRNEHGYRQTSRSGRYPVRRDPPRHVPASDTAREHRPGGTPNPPRRDLPQRRPDIPSKHGPDGSGLRRPRREAPRPPEIKEPQQGTSFPKPEYIPRPDVKPRPENTDEKSLV